MDILKLKVDSQEAKDELIEELSQDLKELQNFRPELVGSKKGPKSRPSRKVGQKRGKKTKIPTTIGGKYKTSVKAEFETILRDITRAIEEQKLDNRLKGESETDITYNGRKIRLTTPEKALPRIAFTFLVDSVKEELEDAKNAEIREAKERDTGPKPNLTPREATPEEQKKRVEDQINSTIKEGGGKSEFDYDALEEQINNLLDVEDFLQYLEEGRSTVYRKKIGMVVESATKVFELFGSLLKSGSDINDILKTILEELKETEKKATYLLSEDKFKGHPYDAGVLRESMKAIQDYFRGSVQTSKDYHTLTTRTVKVLRNLAEFVDSAWKHSAGTGPISLNYNLLGDSLSEQKNNFSFLKILARNDQEHMYRYAPQSKNILMKLVDMKGKGKRYIKHRPDKGESLSKKQENQNKLYDKYLNLGVGITNAFTDFVEGPDKDEKSASEFLKDLESQGFKQRKVASKAEYKFVHEDKKATFTTPNGKAYKVGDVIDAEEYLALIEEYNPKDTLLDYIANQYKRDEGRILDVRMDRKLQGQLGQLKRKIDSMLSSRMEEKPDLEMNVPTTFKDVREQRLKEEEE